ncbi:uncharacterized protein GJ701_003045 isoform 1-T1 [Geothlypis trichas]
MEAQILPLSSQGVWGINPECRQEALKIRNLSLQDELRSWIPWLNFAKAQGSTAACQILPGFEHISLIQIRGTAICTYQDSCGLSLKLGDGPGACFGAGVRDRWNCDRAYKLSQGVHQRTVFFSGMQTLTEISLPGSPAACKADINHSSPWCHHRKKKKRKIKTSWKEMNFILVPRSPQQMNNCSISTDFCYLN